jgi:hypothetical protein
MRARTHVHFVAFLLLASLCFFACSGEKEPETAPQAESRESAPPAEQPSDPALLPIPGIEVSTGELPPDHPPVGRAADNTAIAAPPAGSGEGDTGVRWKAPAGWVAETPSSPMRKAQYRVPGPAGDAECVVFYFGPGQGGGAMANAQRWAGQFKHPDGRPATDALKTTTLAVGNMQVLLVEVVGTYSGGMTMSMAPAEEKPGYMLLGAIAEGPDANWFFKLTGPEATVRAQHEGFAEMVKSLKKGA